MEKYLIFIATMYSLKALAQDNNLSSTNYSISKLHYNDTAANVKQLDIKFRVPLFQKDNNTVVMAVSYKTMKLSNFPVNFGNSLQGLSLQAIWQTKFIDKKNLIIFLQAGIFNDKKNISDKIFRYGIGFRYRSKHSKKLSTGWGLAYARHFFGNQIVPFIDVDYKPNDRWNLTGQFPVKPKILYYFNKKLSTGIELSGEASSYRLGASGSQNRYIQQTQWTGLAKLEYQFGKFWQLNMGVGSNLKQTYKLYNDATTTTWTIITIPLSKKSEPIQNIENRGLNVQVGISFSPFDKTK